MDHVHPSDHFYHQYYPLHHQGHAHDLRNTYNYHNQTVNDEQFGDYGSDLVDEVLEVNTTKCSDDLNMSDESSSTLLIINNSLQGSVAELKSSGKQESFAENKRNITQV